MDSRLCQSTDIKLKGEVVVRVYQQGRLVNAKRYRNVITDVGLEHFCELLVGSTTVSFAYCGVGTGTSTPSPTDEALESELGRVACSERFREAKTAVFLAWFGAEKQFNGTWGECGLFTSETGGVMLARASISLEKTEDKTVLIEWRITLTR